MGIFNALDELIDGAKNVAKDGINAGRSAADLDAGGVAESAVDAAGDAIDGVCDAFDSLFD